MFFNLLWQIEFKTINEMQIILKGNFNNHNESNSRFSLFWKIRSQSNIIFDTIWSWEGAGGLNDKIIKQNKKVSSCCCCCLLLFVYEFHKLLFSFYSRGPKAVKLVEMLFTNNLWGFLLFVETFPAVEEHKSKSNSTSTKV